MRQRERHEQELRVEGMIASRRKQWQVKCIMEVVLETKRLEEYSRKANKLMGRNCDKVTVGLKKREMLRITPLLLSWMTGCTF